MTARVIDDFTGANGASLDSVKWGVLLQGTGGSAAIQDNTCLLTAPANYQKTSVYSKETFTRAEFRSRAKILSGTQFVTFGWGSGYNANYIPYPVNGYSVEVNYLGAVRLDVSSSESKTSLGTGSVGTVTAADFINVALRVKMDGVDVYVWKNLDARPTVPTITSTNVTHVGLTGYIKYSMQSMGAVSSAVYEDIIYDDLIDTNAPPTVERVGYVRYNGNLIQFTDKLLSDISSAGEIG